MKCPYVGPLVSSYAVDDGTRLVLFDPLAPPAEIERLAEEREPAIVLTCPWHRRDAEVLAKRYGARLYVPPPDEGDPSPVDGTVFGAGDRLPVGVEASPGMEPNDLVLWVESHRALVAGDTLQDRGDGLQFLGELPNNVPDGVDTSRSSRASSPCSRCPWRSSCSRTARRPIEPPSSGRSRRLRASTRSRLQPQRLRNLHVELVCGW